jgi:hypothetical protein
MRRKAAPQGSCRDWSPVNLAAVYLLRDGPVLELLHFDRQTTCGPGSVCSTNLDLPTFLSASKTRGG